MAHKRIDEATINSSLDAYLHGAEEGDRSQALKMHELLDDMLTEKVRPEGRLWLTDHGRKLLAEMHRHLSDCDEHGKLLSNHVLEVVQFRSRANPWQDNCSFVKDLRIAIAVANELCAQRDSGQHQDILRASESISERGEFGLDSAEIHHVYDTIAANVGGFKEISGC